MNEPDFSGEWLFSPAESMLQIDRPDSVSFRIVHRKKSFHLERTLTFGPLSDTFSIHLTAGAGVKRIRRGDAVLYPELRQNGDRFVFFTRIIHGGNETTNIVEYHLEAEGKLLIAEERFRSSTQSYDNIWAFRRRNVPAQEADSHPPQTRK